LATRRDHARRTNWKDAPVMGIIAAADAATKSSGSSLTFPILIVLVFVGFYFLMIRPQRRRQQAVAQQQKTVNPGARVRTTAGMYATVTAVDGDDVVLEVAPGVEVRYLKRSIMEVITSGEETETYEDDESAPFDEHDSFDDDHAGDDETPGTREGSDSVKSAEKGLADSHDDLAANKDNVH
jgi:preprotein translocase subunit YajC